MFIQSFVYNLINQTEYETINSAYNGEPFDRLRAGPEQVKATPWEVQPSLAFGELRLTGVHNNGIACMPKR